MNRRIAIVIAFAALVVCLGCPQQPQSGGSGTTAASGASAPPAAQVTAPPPTATNETMPAMNAEASSVGHASGALGISSTTLERVSPSNPLQSRLTLDSTQAKPTGNDGVHDMNRVVDACAAAALASDGDASLLWLADTNKSLDKIQFKVDFAVATPSATMNNPVLGAVTVLSSTQTKVCVTGDVGGSSQTICLTLATDKANALVRWLHQVRVATANASGLDPQRAQLKVADSAAPMVAELTFALKP